MTPPIKTLLVLPHVGTRARVLGPGVLLRTARGHYGWVATVQGQPWITFDNGNTGGGPGRHDMLVLVRDGVEVHEGIDRLRRVADADPACGQSKRIHVALIDGDIAAALGREPGMPPAEAVDRLRSVLRYFGTLVILDGDGGPLYPETDE